MELLWVALLLVVLHWLYRQTRKPANYPPGPFRLPIIGTMWKSHRGKGPPFVRHCAMAREYGKVVGYFTFHQRAVMIFDADLAREVFSKNEATGRPHLEILKMRTFGELRGLLFNDGPSWKRHRRFALQHLRDLGMGRSSLETIVHREVADLMQRLHSTGGQPVSVDHFFNVNVLNVPWEIVAGNRFQPDDPRLPVILRALSDASSRSTGLLQLIPVLLGPRLGAPIATRLYAGIEKNRDGLVDILKEELAARTLRRSVLT